MGIAIVLVLLVIGTVLFHLFSPWWLTPIASNWTTIDTTIDITVWVTGIVFILVNLFMAYAIFRYRYRDNARSEYEPENRRLEIWLTALTTVGIVAMLAPGLIVWAKIITVPDDAMTVEVVGHQWQWTYRFPGQDNQFGTTDPTHFSPDNPFGMNPDDPAGQDDILVISNQVHLPVDKSIKVILRSKDVLHNFAVPQFRVKMDMVPGMVTYFWFTPTRTGAFDVMCQELCGMGHHLMRGRVVIEEETGFQSWLDSQSTYRQIRAQQVADINTGKQLYAVCTACHGPSGEGNQNLNAPAIAGLDAEYVARQLDYFRRGIRGGPESGSQSQQMAAMAGTLADDQAVRNVAAYIASLSPASPDRTLAGNPEKGEAIYRNCAVCHGTQGQGIWTTGAPRLTGVDDWYLAGQLQQFRSGLRGRHPEDAYGAQMVAMAAFLNGEGAIQDVVAYIGTLQDSGSETKQLARGK